MVSHISCRVPWHDNGWNGTICNKPDKNQSCRRCKAIHEGIDVIFECDNAGMRFDEIKKEYIKRPCIREGAAFMSNKNLSVMVSHPYSKSSVWEYFCSLEDTNEEILAYSYPFVPFRWLRKKFSDTEEGYLYEKVKRYGFDFDSSNEKDIERIVDECAQKNGDKSNNRLNWINDGKNQKGIFDGINKGFIPNESLMFFYSKQVPFIEKNNRILIGIGHVKKVNEPIQYKRNNNKGIKEAYLWETMIEHSIRHNSVDDGFLFPFDKILKKQKEDSKFDINQAVVLIDDDYFNEFSYKGEVLSDDAVIDTLYKIKRALEYCEKNKIDFEYRIVFNWIDKEIEKAWKNRGEFPGLGSLLCAYGIIGGYKVANRLKEAIGKTEKFWIRFSDLLWNGKRTLVLNKEQEKSIDEFAFNEWDNIKKIEQRMQLFDLLARISLNYEQMQNIVDLLKNDIKKMEDVIINPYLLYEYTIELDVTDSRRIKLKQLDYAFCPPDDNFVDPVNCKNNIIFVKGAKDKRRIRAYVLDLLIKEVANGNTVYPLKYIIERINNLRLDSKCEISQQSVIDNKEFYESSDMCRLLCSDNEELEYYFKLNKYEEIDSIIKRFYLTNLNVKNRINVNWEKSYDTYVKKNGFNKNKDWKKEDVKALELLANNKTSILTGGAGTGKTSILSILCNEKSIKDKGVLLLAPTGKAAVRMRQNIGLDAMTIARFLVNDELYNKTNGKYELARGSCKNSYLGAQTIIIDESSMITEDMLASLLSYINWSIQRLILVGDYNQLPPIGAGRPFFDIIQYLRNNGYEEQVIELSYNKRQLLDNEKDIRLDVDFANSFRFDNKDYLEKFSDTIVAIKKNKNKNIIFSKSDDSSFDDILIDNLVNVTHVNDPLLKKEKRYMKDKEDIEGFDKSLGANISNGLAYFNHEGDCGNKIGCESYAHNWQIISPIKGRNIGIQNINSLIHSKYKYARVEFCKSKKILPEPMGPEDIVYGDKVIQVKNRKRKTYNSQDIKEDIIMNGEIGIACNFNQSKKYKNLQVEFNGREGITFVYDKSDISTEGEPLLQLAYALTVHKCQGSQFKNIVAVLKKDCGMLSKELIYTALTRHEDKLYIIGDEDLDFLVEYLKNTNSELIRRYTGIFGLPSIIEFDNNYYQKGLIHIGDGGQLLRSKSEVIIWNKLYEHRNEFESIYEKRFAKNRLLPDFTIINNSGNIEFIWEHLGLTNDLSYAKRWKEKEKIYKENGFTEKKGNLIITRDNEKGAIDSEDINAKVKSILNKILQNN